MVKIKKNNNKEKKDLLVLFSTFYPKFYILETLLKKKIVNEIENKFGSNWYDEVKEKIKLFSDEIELIIRRKKKDLKIDSRLFIHEASFGFWIELFGRENYKHLKGLPIKVFENLPGDIKRNDLYRMLSNIKELRNKLYHHRIDLSHELTIKDVQFLTETEKDLRLIIHFLDSDYAELIQPFEFSKQLAKIVN